MGAGFSIFFLMGGIVPLLLLASIILAIRALWRSLTLPRPRIPEPACERCRYPVAGLTTLDCPECGTNLHLTGIITGPMEMRRRGGLWPAILAWTYLILIIGLIAPTFVGGIFLARTTSAAAMAGPQVWTTPLTPASAAYTQISIASSSNISAGGGASDITLTLTLSDGSNHKLQLDPANDSYTTTDPLGLTTPPAPFDKTSIPAWFTAAGLSAADNQITAEADELTSIVQAIMITPFVQPSSMSLKHLTPGPPTFSGATGFSPSGSTPTWAYYLFAAALAALLIWIAGIVFIVIRRRKLLFEPEPPPLPIPDAPPTAPRPIHPPPPR